MFKFLDKTGLDTFWAKIKSTFQTLGNLVTSWGSTPSDTKYPSEKLVKDSLGGKLDKTGDASNTTSTFTKASGDTSSVTSGGKLSAIFTAISSFFASLKALAFKDSVGTSEIDNDSITAAKVKDNETLPVNISGNAGNVSHSVALSGTTYNITGVTGDTAGNYQPKTIPSAKFYKDNNNGSIVIVGNPTGTDGVSDRGLIRLAAGNGHYSNVSLSNDTPNNVDTVIATPDVGGTRAIPAFAAGVAVGNSTTPVFVGANGRIQACTPSSMTVGKAYSVRDYITLQSGTAGVSVQYQEIGTSPYKGSSGSSTTIILQGQGNIGKLTSTWIFTFHCRNTAGPVMEVYSFGPTYSRIDFGYWKDSSDIYHFIAKYPEWCKSPVTMQCINKDGYFTFNVKDATTTEPTGVVYAAAYNTVSAPYGQDVGTSSTPVYVDSTGRVQPCTPSSMYVGWASNVNLSKTANAVNGDSIQAGTGASVTIGNAGNAKTWDGHAISIGEVSANQGTISIV